jgi:hypothetical protein
MSDPSGEAIKLLLDRSADAHVLRRAVTRIDDTQMPAARWLQLSNDAGYGLPHRRIAAVELLRRHVRPGMALGSVAALLRGAAWLEDGHVRLVEDISGRPAPVPVHLDGTVVAIDLLPGDGIAPSVFLRLQGDVTRDEVSRLLRGAPVPALQAVPVLDIGFLDT